MHKKKGFIHVIEIIIVSILVLFVFVQFSYMPYVEIDWSTPKLSLQGNDLLFMLDELGVNWLNANDINSKLSGLLTGNTMYRVIVIDQDSNVQTIVDNPIPSDSVTLSFFKTISGNIYEVILTLGYLY